MHRYRKKLFKTIFDASKSMSLDLVTLIAKIERILKIKHLVVDQVITLIHLLTDSVARIDTTNHLGKIIKKFLKFSLILTTFRRNFISSKW